MNRVTDIIARHRATAIDVCRGDKTVALHCATPGGIVVVICDLQEFVLKCRAHCDHNRNPLPSVEDLRAQAEEFAPDPLPIDREIADARRMPADQLARYRAAAREFVSGICTTKVQAARRAGIPARKYTAFAAWMRLQVRARSQPDDGRAPLLKPNGRLL